MANNHQHTTASPSATAAGLVLVDKPQSWTSHDVVGKIRRLAGTRKVGHAGTLDPMATGLLVIGINKATKLLTHLVGANKTYTATIRLGQNTDTDDADGTIIQTRYANAVTQDMINAAIESLTGDIDQVPSSVSAIKVDGKRAYARIRAGETVELQARRVNISDFTVHKLTRYDGGTIQDLDVTVSCSSGTYIRALARDLGELINTGGHLTALRRTHVGPYSIEDAHTIEELEHTMTFMPLDEAVTQLFPVRELTNEQAQEIVHGRFIGANTIDDLVVGINPARQAVALLRNKTHKAAAEETSTYAKPELVFLSPQELK